MAGNVLQLGIDTLRRGFRWRENEYTKLWYRRFSRADFSAGAVSADVDVNTFNGGVIIEGAFGLLIQNFAGGGAATCTLSVGTTGSPTAYINAQSIFSGASAGNPIPIVGVTLVPGTALNATNPAALATVRFRVTASVNTNLLTTGVVDVYLRLRALRVKPA